MTATLSSFYWKNEDSRLWGSQAAEEDDERGFVEATRLAKEENGIFRSAKAWQKKFTRMKQEYSAYIAKISQSGRDGDDDTLYNKSAIFAVMHELEHAKARHSPPAVLSSNNDMTEAGLSLSSSRKRMKLSSSSMLECYIEERRERMKN